MARQKRTVVVSETPHASDNSVMVRAATADGSASTCSATNCAAGGKDGSRARMCTTVPIGGGSPAAWDVVLSAL